MSLTPPFLEAISTGGLQKTVCVNVAMTRSHTALWHFLFLISKVAELGDTVFIVLRKSPLHLLHWYHHITVLVYSWYGLFNNCAKCHWDLVLWTKLLCAHSHVFLLCSEGLWSQIAHLNCPVYHNTAALTVLCGSFLQHHGLLV